MNFYNYVCAYFNNDSVWSRFCDTPVAVVVICLVFFSFIFFDILVKVIGGRELGTKRKNIQEVFNKPVEELEIAKLAIGIERERDLFRAVFSSMEEGFLVIDRDLKVVLMNQKAAVLLRVAPKEAAGRQIEEILRFFPAQKEAGYLASELKILKNIAKGLDFLNIRMEDDYYCKNKNGGNFPVAMTIAPFLKRGKGGEGAIIIFKDITEEKEIDRSKSEFVSLASHQLQAPLVSISWYTEVLLGRDIGSLNKGQKEYLEEVYNSGQRMKELVNALLNVSRVELGVLDINPQPINLSEIVADILKEFQGQIKSGEIEVTQKYDEGLADVKADPVVMRAVFQNLISNAIKYSFEKGVVYVGIKKQNSEILIEVTDKGCGIPREQQSRMFTKLFRAHNALQRVPEGNGLGLYVIKRLLDQSGGKIWFFSEGVDKGSSFYVSLPETGMKAKGGSKKLREMV